MNNIDGYTYLFTRCCIYSFIDYGINDIFYSLFSYRNEYYLNRKYVFFNNGFYIGLFIGLFKIINNESIMDYFIKDK